MVQLRDESSETSENSTVAKGPRQRISIWPFFVLALAVGLVAVGVHYIRNPDDKIGCPYSAIFGSKGVKNPHLPPEKTAENEETVGLIDEEYDKSIYTEELVYGGQKKLAPVFSGRVITKEQLAEHGRHSANPWVAVLGQIYDVTAGKRLYGDDGTYNFFSGKDGSRAYSTGQFDEEGLTDDLKDLKPQQIGEIYHWINIFSKKYPFVGRLEGPFFDSAGSPTAHWREIESSLADLSATEKLKGELKRKYPSCNSHYDQSAGRAEVWCTEKSGGVSRAWMGVPRQLHLPGESVRCACIPKSLLKDPKLKEYPNCLPNSNSCLIKLQ